MMKLLAFALIVVAAPIGAHGANPPIVLVEEAAEVSRLELQPGAGDGTRIYARICDQCQLLNLRISENTRVFRRKTPITLRDATQLRGIGATVLFDPQSKDITRIIFWR